MKRLGTLALAVILITGCNAMKPNIEETELLSKEIEKRIYTQAWPTEASEITESTQVPTQAISQEKTQPAEPVQAEKPMGAMQTTEPETTSKTTAYAPYEEAEENIRQPAESAKIIEWPYITCPPKPDKPNITAPEPPATTPEWPCITAPEQPTYTPEPEPTEPPQEEPTPTPQPVPDVPAAPVPEPTEQPIIPSLDPTAEPQAGYAECSCGAKLTPDELLPHMKAHAMSGESHSYRAY